jgi:branched-chain amino acid transport system substrate-binding protein
MVTKMNIKILRSKEAITKIQATALAVIILVAVIAGVCYYLLQRPAMSESIPIGFISELTGVYSFYGLSAMRGAELAVTEINQKGGVLGRNITLIIQDDQTASDKALSAMLLLDTQYHVPIVTGPQSSDIALALKEYAETHQVPLITGVANHPGITKPGTKWGFKTQIDGVRIGVTAARFMLSLNKTARIAYVAFDNALGRQSVAGFKWEINRQGGNLVYEQFVPPTQTEFAALVASIKVANPDYVWDELTAAGGVNLFKELINAGFRSDQIVYSWTTSGTMKSLGPIAQGCYLTLSWDRSLDIPAAKEFATKYQATYGEPADYINALQYQAIYAIAAAIEKAGSIERDAIRVALHQINITTIFPTNLSYDENGHGFNHQLICQNIICNSTYFENRVVSIFIYQPDEVPVYQLAGVV